MSAQAAEIRTPDIKDDNLPVGEILRRSRVYYNQSVDEVAGILRIRSTHLEAIEQGRIDDLPGRVYAFGFVRAYAEYLGLDGEKIVKLFKTQIGAPVNDRPDLHMPVAASESKSPNMAIIIGSLLVLVAGGIAMMYTGGDDQETAPSEAKIANVVHEIPPVPQEMYEDTGDVGPFQPAAAVTQQAAASAQAEVAAGQQKAAQASTGPVATSSAPVTTSAPPANAPVVLKLKESAWVEIRDVSGKALLSRILKPGDSYIVPATVKGLVLDTGNVGALEFTVDNKILAPFGEKGDVRRGIKLEPEFLRDLDTRTARRAASTAPAAGGQ